MPPFVARPAPPPRPPGVGPDMEAQAAAPPPATDVRAADRWSQPPAAEAVPELEWQAPLVEETPLVAASEPDAPDVAEASEEPAPGLRSEEPEEAVALAAWEPEALDDDWDAADAEPTAAADDVEDWPDARSDAPKWGDAASAETAYIPAIEPYPFLVEPAGEYGAFPDFDEEQDTGTTEPEGDGVAAGWPELEVASADPETEPNSVAAAWPALDVASADREPEGDGVALEWPESAAAWPDAERVAAHLEALADAVRQRGLGALGAGASTDEAARLDELSRLIAAVVAGFYGRQR
jgi:hypothetical protein